MASRTESCNEIVANGQFFGQLFHFRSDFGPIFDRKEPKSARTIEFGPEIRVEKWIDIVSVKSRQLNPIQVRNFRVKNWSEISVNFRIFRKFSIFFKNLTYFSKSSYFNISDILSLYRVFQIFA